MIKKIFLSIVMLCALSVMFSASVSAQSYLLGMIDVSFCNQEQSNNELDLVTKASESLPICVQYTNTSTVPITINAEFLDSVVTSDSKKNRACNASDRPKTQFGNFMLPYSWDFTLASWETIKKTYEIKYPIGFSGLSHGCLAYYVVGTDIVDSSIFTIRIRSTKYIDVFVSNTTAVQSIKVSQSPILTATDDEHILSFGIKNEGNVEEKVHITSTLSNVFGYQKEFIFDTIIPANTWIILTTPSFILPTYGWPFRFKSRISYTPQFNFNIIWWTHPSKIYSWWIKTAQTLLFVWTRQSRTAIGIVLLILYSIFRTKKKIPSEENTWDLK